MQYADEKSGKEKLQNDIRAALELGIDGFALNVFSGKQAKGLFTSFIKAADEIGAYDFKLFLSADMSLGFSAEDIVETIRLFGANDHYYKIKGKPLLSTYGGGNKGDQWWKDNVLLPLQKENREVTFVPYFDRGNPNAVAPSYENWIKAINKYPSIDGLFNFLMPGSTPFYTSDKNIGHHWWSILEAEENLAKALKDSGKIFMAPFMPYYWATCHSARQYMEHQGGRGMHNYWQSIIEKQRPDIVQIVTWNDYAESTYIQPTRKTLEKTKGIKSYPHLGYYELLKYYVSWYKSGSIPRIIRDSIFFFYRTHPKDAVALDDASVCSKGAPAEHQKWGLIKDTIYITTALTEPAQLEVITGGEQKIYNVPEGINTIDVPFNPGSQEFILKKGTKIKLQAKGIDVSAQPNVYNFNVYSGYAIMNGSTSEDWLPSDGWKHGYTPNWFVK